MRFYDRSGERVGPLRIVGRAEKRGVEVKWIAECVCGRRVEASRRTLKRVEDRDPEKCCCERLLGVGQTAIGYSERINAALEEEKGKDEWQIEVMRRKLMRDIARSRC